jgi:hypothetical protein
MGHTAAFGAGPGGAIAVFSEYSDRPSVSYRASRRRRIAGESPGTAMICSLLTQLLPGPAAPHAGRLFRDDVRARAGAFVPDLDQDPALRTGPRQREATGQLAAVQDKREVARLVSDDIGGPLVPDDHRAGPAPLALVYALELPG